MNYMNYMKNRVCYKNIKQNIKAYRRMVAFILVSAMVLLMVSGCGKDKSDKTITLNIWHVYGEQADSPLNDLIDEFNSTVGMQKGITVKPTKVSDTNTLHEAVLESEKGGPGTENLPDIFVAYPKTVLAMQDDTKLVDFNDYLSEEEKDAFIDDFLEEGDGPPEEKGHWAGRPQMVSITFRAWRGFINSLFLWSLFQVLSSLASYSNPQINQKSKNYYFH